jgi:hypothetical protein
MPFAEGKKVVRCSCGAALAVPAGFKGRAVSCPRCNRSVEVPAGPALAEEQTAVTTDPAPSPRSVRWFVARGKDRVGPLSTAQLKQMAGRDELSPEDMLLRSGETKWVRAGTIPGLFDGPASRPARPREKPALRRSSPLPWLLAGAAVVVLLLVAAVGLYFLLPSPMPPGPVPLAQNVAREGPDLQPRQGPNEGPDRDRPRDGGNQEPNRENPKEQANQEPNPGKEDPPAEKATLDLSHVSGDFHAAVVVQPRRILESRLGAKALTPEQLKEAEQGLGVAPKNVEQVIVVLDRAPPEPLPAKKEEPKDGWFLVDSREGKFSARFPKEPKKEERKTFGGTRQVWLAEVDKGTYEYELSYYDFTGDFANLGPESQLDTATRGLEIKAGFQGKKPIRLDKFPGAEVVIDDKDFRTYAIHRVFLVGNRVYHLTVTSHGKQAEDAARFFESFRVTGGPPGPEELFPKELIPLPGVIVRFRAPVDGRALAARWLGEVKEEKWEGKTILKGGGGPPLGMPLAAHVPNDRTLLLGAEPVLRKMLTAQGRGSLVERLKALGASFDLAAVFLPAPYHDFLNGLAAKLGPALPPPWNEAAPLAGKIDAVQVVADLRGKKLLAVSVETRDEPSAQKLEKLAQDGVAVARKMAPAVQPLLTSPSVPKPVQKDLLALADQLFNGLEVKTAGKDVRLSAARPARQAAVPVAAALKPHLPKGDREEVSLGGEVADVAVGGGGRYLVYSLKGQKKLAVFDVQEGKVVKEVPLPEEQASFTAGARQLVVASPGQRLLTLWNLATLEKEKTAPLPEALAGDEIKQMVMGSASAGPVFFCLPRDKRTVALDLARMTTRPVAWKHFGGGAGAWGPVHLRASADGSVLLGWGGGWAGLEMLRFEDGRPAEGSDQFAFSLGVFALPSADGRLVFHPDGMVGPDLKPGPAPRGCYLVPAEEPGFFLALHGGQLPFGVPGQGLRLPGVNQVTVFSEDRSQLLLLTDLAELKEGSALPWEKTLHFYPRGGLLVTLAGKDKVVLRRLDLVERLGKSGVDYLFVFPQPASGKTGQLFRQQLDIRSKRGGLEVKLVSGPEGLKVSPEGLVSWPIPADFPDPEATARFRIRDVSGQEVAYQLRVAVAEE